MGATCTREESKAFDLFCHRMHAYDGKDQLTDSELELSDKEVLLEINKLADEEIKINSCLIEFFEKNKI